VHELAILALVIATGMVAVTVTFAVTAPALRYIESALLFLSILVILFAAFFVGAEVVMRYWFDSPIPGHLELSELLVPLMVFFAISYTQSTHGHVGMDLLLDALSPGARRYAEMGTLLISIFICAVLAYFSGKNAIQLWRYDDVTMSPPYYKTWPSGAAIPVGYTLICLRMFVQFLHLLNPTRFSAHEPDDGGFHAVE
jgi:TRAP-type C4-dicarboxylate transport system permease small subunit